MAEEADKSRGSGTNLVWPALAIIADSAAVVALATSRTGMIVTVLGTVTLFAGMYHLTAGWGRPLDHQVALAIVTIVAGAVALTVVVDRALLSIGNASSTRAGEAVPPSGGVGSFPAAPSTTDASSDAPPSLSLLNTTPMADQDENFIAGPLNVNGAPYQRVKSYKFPCSFYSADPVSDTYQIDHKYRVLRAQIGLGDESSSYSVVEFSVVADGVIKYSESVRIGQTKPIEVDISEAFRVELRAEVPPASFCGPPGTSAGSVFGAWIDPVLTG